MTPLKESFNVKIEVRFQDVIYLRRVVMIKKFIVGVCFVFQAFATEGGGDPLELLFGNEDFMHPSYSHLSVSVSKQNIDKVAHGHDFCCQGGYQIANLPEVQKFFDELLKSEVGGSEYYDKHFAYLNVVEKREGGGFQTIKGVFDSKEEIGLEIDTQLQEAPSKLRWVCVNCVTRTQVYLDIKKK